MAKYKYTDKVFLVDTGEEVIINKVSTNYSSGKIKYYLEDGRIVSEGELTKVKPSKEEPKKTRKKRSVSVVEQSAQSIENKEVEKNDISGENTPKD